MMCLARARRPFAAASDIMVDQPIISVVTGLAGNPPHSNPVQHHGSVFRRHGVCQSHAASGLAPSSVNPNFKNGYIVSYNLNVQQDLGHGAALQVGYIGSQGRHLRLNRNINQFTTRPGRRRVFGHSRRFSIDSPILPGLRSGNITYNDYSVCRTTTQCG